MPQIIARSVNVDGEDSYVDVYELSNVYPQYCKDGN